MESCLTTEWIATHLQTSKPPNPGCRQSSIYLPNSLLLETTPCRWSAGETGIKGQTTIPPFIGQIEYAFDDTNRHSLKPSALNECEMPDSWSTMPSTWTDIVVELSFKDTRLTTRGIRPPATGFMTYYLFDDYRGGGVLKLHRLKSRILLQAIN